MVSFNFQIQGTILEVLLEEICLVDASDALIHSLWEAMMDCDSHGDAITDHDCDPVSTITDPIDFCKIYNGAALGLLPTMAPGIPLTDFDGSNKLRVKFQVRKSDGSAINGIEVVPSVSNGASMDGLYLHGLSPAPTIEKINGTPSPMGPYPCFDVTVHFDTKDLSAEATVPAPDTIEISVTEVS